MTAPDFQEKKITQLERRCKRLENEYDRLLVRTSRNLRFLITENMRLESTIKQKDADGQRVLAVVKAILRLEPVEKGLREYEARLRAEREAKSKKEGEGCRD